MLPNAIVAGTNKAGTTSLFRYLADHPDVSTSTVKEVRFFSRLEGEITAEDVARYESHFPSDPTEKVVLEASPNYLAGGERVAVQIAGLLPEAKLIFVLRDPVERLLSAFRRRSERAADRLGGLDCDAYVDRLLASATAEAEDGAETMFRSELRSVCYAEHLAAFHRVVDAERIHVALFDELRADPRGFMREVARFLEIDPAFYAGYRFEVENKTRTYRSRTLQKLAFRANMAAEPVLNKVPGLKRRLRTIYNAVNEGRQRPVEIERARRDALEDYFRPRNADLLALLEREHPRERYPRWLTGIGSQASAPPGRAPAAGRGEARPSPP